MYILKYTHLKLWLDQFLHLYFQHPKRPLSNQTLLTPCNHYSDCITCHYIWLCHFLNLQQKEHTVYILFVSGFLRGSSMLLHITAIFVMLTLAHLWPMGSILSRILCVPLINPIHLWKLPCFLAQDSILRSSYTLPASVLESTIFLKDSRLLVMGVRDHNLEVRSVNVPFLGSFSGQS